MSTEPRVLTERVAGVAVSDADHESKSGGPT